MHHRSILVLSRVGPIPGPRRQHPKQAPRQRSPPQQPQPRYEPEHLRSQLLRCTAELSFLSRNNLSAPLQVLFTAAGQYSRPAVLQLHRPQHRRPGERTRSPTRSNVPPRRWFRGGQSRPAVERNPAIDRSSLDRSAAVAPTSPPTTRATTARDHIRHSRVRPGASPPALPPSQPRQAPSAAPQRRPPAPRTSQQAH